MRTLSQGSVVRPAARKGDAVRVLLTVRRHGRGVCVAPRPARGREVKTPRQGRTPVLNEAAYGGKSGGVVDILPSAFLYRPRVAQAGRAYATPYVECVCHGMANGVPTATGTRKLGVCLGEGSSPSSRGMAG